MDHIKSLFSGSKNYSFEDLEDSLQLLLSKASDRSTKRLSSTILEVRKQLLDWLIIVNKKLNLSPSCFYLQVEIFDSFLEKSNFDLDPNDLHMLAVTVLRLATKFDEVKYLCLETTMKHICHGRYQKQDLIVFELFLLKTIKYKIKSCPFENFAEIMGKLFFPDQYMTELKTYMDYVHRLVLLDYKFYRGQGQAHLYLSITLFCLEKIKLSGKKDYDPKILGTLLEVLSLDSRKVVRTARSIWSMEEGVTSDMSLTYFKQVQI